MQKFYLLSRRAFTLAELMAVVVIVAIIAGIGFGSYRKSSGRAEFAEGRSLAQQVAAARDAYYYDNRDYLGSSSGSIPTTLEPLALEIKGRPHFSLELRNARFVRAEHEDGHYSICVYQEAAYNQNAPQERCVYHNGDGQDFCESMGYKGDNLGESC